MSQFLVLVGPRLLKLYMAEDVLSSDPQPKSRHPKMGQRAQTLRMLLTCSQLYTTYSVPVGRSSSLTES